MTAISFKGFRGAVPRAGQRLQQPRFAKYARNIKITSGDVVPLKGLRIAADTLASNVRTIWRYRHKVGETYTDRWLTFAEDSDVLGSPVANDRFGRVYWTSGAHEPRTTRFSAAISGSGPYPAASYQLGVPLPQAAPAVSVSGGTGTNVTRSYAYTFVNDMGEESGPSPASAVTTGRVDGFWTLSGLDTAPASSGAVSTRTNLPGGELVRLGVTNTKWIEVGKRVVISGVAQFSVGGLGRDLNGTHRVVAVDKVGNTFDVELPPQNNILMAGTWAHEAPFYTSGLRMRVYHTQGTLATFLFLAEISPVATYTHTTPASGEQMPTINSLPPPDDLKCLVALPNGCFAGLTENEVCFSEPYMPYSWPIGNRYSFVARGVALGVAGNSVIVLTDSHPILVTGSDPEGMSLAVLETYAPCVSKRGAVDIGGGLLYPSHDGLWLAAGAGVQNRTSALYRLDEWRALAPETFEAEFHDGQYIAVHTPVGGKKQMLVLDVAELDSAVAIDDAADALHRSVYDGHLYLAKGGEVFKFDADQANPYTSEWSSVDVQMDRPRNFSHAQVHADWLQASPPDTEVTDANAALLAAGADAVNGHLIGGEINAFEINGSNLRAPAEERSVQFILMDERGARYSRSVSNSRPFRLPSGFMQEVVRIGVNTKVPVFSVRVAESSAELSGEP
jgi:hypothetical protein